MREPKGATENEFVEEHAIFDLRNEPTANWPAVLKRIEAFVYWHDGRKRKLGPTALRRLYASALLECADRGDPLPQALAKRAARALAPRTIRDRARKPDKQKRAADYLARHPDASHGEIARHIGASRSTVQGFRKQPRFEVLVAEAKGRLLDPKLKVAAIYLALHPDASDREIARHIGASRSTVQGFRKQPRFKMFVDEAEERLLDPEQKL